MRSICISLEHWNRSLIEHTKSSNSDMNSTFNTFLRTTGAIGDSDIVNASLETRNQDRPRPSRIEAENI